MKVRAVFGVFLILLIAGPALAEPVAHHEMHLQIVPAKHLLVCTDRITMPGPDGVRTVKLRVRPEFKLLSVRAEGEGTLQKPSKAGPPFLVLPVRFHDGAAVFTVQYKLVLSTPVKKSSAFSFVVGDFTDGYIGPEGVYLPGGSGWYPETGGMARTTVEVMAPSPWRAVAQGRKIDEKVVSLPGEDGKTADNIVSRWEEKLPSDGLSLVAGPYLVETLEHKGITLSAYLFSEHIAMAPKLLKATAAYLDFYTILLGPYPFTRFDIVENFFTSGYGMPGYTLLGSRVLDVIRMIGLRPGFIDHELVHNWWGNSVYVDYATGNWCEGATTYCANYYGGREARSADEGTAYRRLVSRKYTVNVGRAKDYPVREFRSKKEDFDNDIGYGKASMFFHLLRKTVGHEPFWKALRSVAKNFQGRKARWDDFRTALEKAGGKDLKALFVQWIDWNGAPVFWFESRVLDGQVVGTLLVYNSRDKNRGYDLTVPLRVTFGDGTQMDIPVVVRKGRAEWKIQIRGGLAVRSVAVDPDFHVFRALAPDEVTPSLNATLASGQARIVSGLADPAQKQALAWAAKRMIEHGKGLAGVESDLASPPGRSRGFVLLGKAVSWNVLSKVLRTEKAGFSFTPKDGKPAFQINGASYASPEAALLVSFRLPGGAFATILRGNSAAAVRPLRNLFHYGWDQFVVFLKGRPVARGEIKASKTPALAADPIEARVARIIEKLAKDPHGRICPKNASPKTRGPLTDFLARELAEATGQTVDREPFSFVVPKEGQVGVVEMAGKLIRMELATPMFFPALPLVQINLKGQVVKLPAAGAEFTHVLTADEVPGETPGPCLLFLRLAGRYRTPQDLVAALEAAPEDIKGVVLFDPDAKAPAKPHGRQPLLAQVLETTSERPAMRIAGFLSRMKKKYVGPICLAAPDTGGGFHLSGKVSGRIFLVRGETKVWGENLSARVGGAPEDGPEILLTAHFDGLGQGHEGADDNASGVACVLETARMLQGADLERPVRIVLFDAEEWGLRGSRAYAARYAERTYRVLNVDAVGSRSQKKVYVLGRSKYPDIFGVLDKALQSQDLVVGGDIDRFAFAYGSDHWSFVIRGIKAVGLYSSQRTVMNTTDDTREKVDHAKIVRLARALAAVVKELAR
jgi:hypothetical protein